MMLKLALTAPELQPLIICIANGLNQEAALLFISIWNFNFNIILTLFSYLFILHLIPTLVSINNKFNKNWFHKHVTKRTLFSPYFYFIFKFCFVYLSERLISLAHSLFELKVKSRFQSILIKKNNFWKKVFKLQ